MTAGATAGPGTAPPGASAGVAAPAPPSRPVPKADLLAALEDLVGFAPSEILARRLDRARPLAAAVDAGRPSVEDPAWAALLDALTVQETRLFRTASQLLAFRDRWLPGLFDSAGARPLSLLSAGCATGEEAWSLGLIAATAAQARGAPLPAVLGLDICRAALAVAESGRYQAGPPDALREVPTAYRGQFGLEGDSVVPPGWLRPLVRFARGNLLELPPATVLFDAICCRNVLIYLTDPARAAVLQALAARLVPGGVLLLGATDSPPAALGLAAPDGGAIWRRPG